MLKTHDNIITGTHSVAVSPIRVSNLGQQQAARDGSTGGPISARNNSNQAAQMLFNSARQDSEVVFDQPQTDRNGLPSIVSGGVSKQFLDNMEESSNSDNDKIPGE